MSYDSNLDRLTVIDLRAIAADLKIAGRSKMKRAELVAAITEAEAVNAATAEHENEEIDLTSTIDDMISGWMPAEVAEQPDRASYYSGTVPCFERTTVDGIGYGCVKLGDHVEHSTALGAAWWVAAEQADTGKIAITKYSGHEAFGTAVFEGRSIGGHATRERGRWVLRVEMGRTIRAKTLGKVARQWAKSLGFYAATIDVETMS